MGSKRNSYRASQLRRIVKTSYNFTCQLCKKQLCPVGDRCYETDPLDELIKNFCHGKSDCIFQVHHEKKTYGEIKNTKLTILQEAKLCVLLCKDCHGRQH